MADYRKKAETINRLLEYCPHKPWPKQELFLTLDCKEALYGGAAGGGKSDALLMGALQYVHVPKYAALILRTDSARLRLSGGLVPRSQEWLHGKAEWNGTDRRWIFPNGASIQFGYLETANDKYRYGSSEYQYIGFDELTEFTEEDYTFLFSRLRMTLDIEQHGVPYRIRGASNPGGRGHEWVKSRFVTKEAEIDLKNDVLKGVYLKESKVANQPRAFVPAKVKDNPAVNLDSYRQNLMHLSPVVRERLLNGDWTVMPTGLIRSEWLRYYTMQDRLYRLLISRIDPAGNIIHTNEVASEFHEETCRRFATVDTAGGMKDINKEAKGKGKSWTACGVWDYRRTGPGKALILKHVWRAQAGFVEVRDNLLRLYEEWKPTSIRVEDKTMGPDLYSLLCGQIPISLIGSGNIDKVTRAAPFLNMLDQGQVYLPQGENSWRSTLEAEWLSWQGLEDDTNDQIDMASYAAIEVGSHIAGTIKVAVDPRKPMDISPGPHQPAHRGWF